MPAAYCKPANRQAMKTYTLCGICLWKCCQCRSDVTYCSTVATSRKKVIWSTLSDSAVWAGCCTSVVVSAKSTYADQVCRSNSVRVHIKLLSSVQTVEYSTLCTLAAQLCNMHSVCTADTVANKHQLYTMTRSVVLLNTFDMSWAVSPYRSHRLPSSMSSAEHSQPATV